MTEDFLRRIEREEIAPHTGEHEEECSCHRFRAFVDEVRRLKALVKSVESAGDIEQGGETAACPWCWANAPHHAADCPAFAPDGAVR